MIESYLVHRLTWRSAGPRDFYGEAQYVNAEIPCRWEGRRGLVRDENGSQVVSEAKVYCTAPVQPGDVMVDSQGNEWPVIAVSEMSGLDGDESHRELAL